MEVWMSGPRDPVLRRRVVSALVLAPTALALLWLGDIFFSAWVAAFAAAMAWEWMQMSDPKAPPVAYAIACATACGTVLLAGQTDISDALFWGGLGTLATAAERWRRGWSIQVLGVLYISLSAGLLAAMRGDLDHGLESVVLLLAIVWAADSFAYLVGTWIGGPKLLPIASPQKTWAGLVAGIIAGAGAGIGIGYLFGLSYQQVMAFSLFVATAAVAGDLIMSLFKRGFKVKDSGTLIPGHGGVLDRVDALMLAVIIAVLVLAYFPITWPAGGLAL
jgi:phosphatidate cytidylyltransferase